MEISERIIHSMMTDIRIWIDIKPQGIVENVLFCLVSILVTDNPSRVSFMILQ
ncbi:hypothetical protein PRIPAC_74136 [Pristionchus pacificus]|nr:hypothetical protein PRIPAC_74136 [Pristionchus pacificus]